MKLFFGRWLAANGFWAYKLCPDFSILTLNTQLGAAELPLELIHQEYFHFHILDSIDGSIANWGGCCCCCGSSAVRNFALLFPFRGLSSAFSSLACSSSLGGTITTLFFLAFPCSSTRTRIELTALHDMTEEISRCTCF